MLKKILVSLAMVFTATFTISTVASVSVAAEPNKYGIDGTTCNNYLGFTSWNCGVNIENEETLKTGLWTIVTNILTDITVAAAYLVLSYVIYGGYLYISSTGDPSKVSAAKKTLAHAFIGLAIVLLANVILNSIRVALLGANGSFATNCATDECINPSDMVKNIIQWVIGIAGVVSAIFVVYGGIAYATSSGDPSKIQKAKSTIIYALIGLAVVALAEIITAFVSNMIRESNKTSQINQTIISKEVYEIKTS